MKSALFCIITLLAAGPLVAKDKPVIAGVYKGKVQGEVATATFKADGTLTVNPTPDDPDVVLRGTWRRQGNRVIGKLRHRPGGEGGTVVFQLAGADLMVLKITNPDGEVQQVGPPIFARTKALAKKGLAGVYEGTFDDDQLVITLKVGGTVNVSPKEDDSITIFTGQWKAAKNAVTINGQDEDGERTKVELLLGERGLMMRRLTNANGDVTEFAPARLKRQPGGAKKDGK